MIEGPFSVHASLCTSLVPRPEEGEEEKGSGFSHSSMCLTITDMSGRVLMMPSKSHGWMHDVATYCIKLTRVAFLSQCFVQQPCTVYQWRMGDRITMEVHNTLVIILIPNKGTLLISTLLSQILLVGLPSLFSCALRLTAFLTLSFRTTIDVSHKDCLVFIAPLQLYMQKTVGGLSCRF